MLIDTGSDIIIIVGFILLYALEDTHVKTLFEQVAVLYIFIAIGYILAKLKKIDHTHVDLLSRLVVYVLLPCSCLHSFASNFNIAYITAKYPLLIASSVLMVGGGVAMHYFAKLFSKEKYERSIYEYSLTMTTYASTGFPLILGVFGEAALTDAMIFFLPVSIYTYSYGYSILTKRPISLKKLTNPTLISMIVGMIVGLILPYIDLPADGSPLRIPVNVVSSIVDGGKACLSPICMFIVGIAISEFKIKSLVNDKRSYIVTALRLLILPITFGGLLWVIGIRNEILTNVLLYTAMPCGMNTIVFPRLIGEKCNIGASLALLSNLFACLTIPLVLIIFGIVV